MKIFTAAVFVAVSLVPIRSHAQEETKKSEAPATVYFYRLREFYASALKPSIYSDKKQVVRMRNGRFISITLPPGDHTITSNFPGSGVILTVKAGETYYVKLHMSSAGAFHGSRGEVTEVAPGQGKFEVSQLKPAEPEDLKDGNPAPSSAPPAL